MPLTYTRELNDDEVKILENDLIDVKAWIDSAIDGKLNQCTKRIQTGIIQTGVLSSLIKIDADPVKAFFKLSGYKNRRERDSQPKV